MTRFTDSLTRPLRPAVGGLILLVACVAGPEPADLGDSEPLVMDLGPADIMVVDAPAPLSAAPGAEAPIQDPNEDLLAREVRLQSLTAQKRAVLRDEHLAQAQAFRDQLRLEDARLEAGLALQLDHTSEAARLLLDELDTLLGNSEGGRAALGRELEAQYSLRLQQMRAQAEDALNRGRMALARSEFERAAKEFGEVLQHIRWAPDSISWGAAEAQATALLQEARQRGEAESAQLRAEKESASLAQLRATEAQEVEARQARLDTILDQALDAFDAGAYDESRRLAEEVLDLDRRDPRARELIETAVRVRNESVERGYLLSKEKRFRGWRQDILEARIPYTAILTKPDRDYWRHITELRADQAVTTVGVIESEQVEAIREALATKTIPGIRFEAEFELETLVNPVRQYAGVNVIVDPAAVMSVEDAGVEFNLDLPYEVSVGDYLQTLVDYSEGSLAVSYRDYGLRITTPAKAAGEPIVRVHDVRDLVFPITNYLGPNLMNLRLPDADTEEEGGPAGVVDEDRPPQPLVSPDALEELILRTIDPESWDEEGRSFANHNGNLIITHTPTVQAKVAEFLTNLRKFSGILVTIETRFLEVKEGFLQEIGVEWRGLGGSNGGSLANLDDVTNGLEDDASQGLDNDGSGGSTADSSSPSSGAFFSDGNNDIRFHSEFWWSSPLGDALTTAGGTTIQVTILDDTEMSMILSAVEKAESAQIANQQSLSVTNGQSAYIGVMNQISYVQDYEAQVAQASAITDPVIGVVNDGIVLEVRPVVAHDRASTILQVKPTIASLVRPFRTQTLTLGNFPATLQLPELRASRAATSAVVPDGATMLIGGLKRIRNVERRAEVPMLGSIPFLGAFFKEEGVSEEISDLVILLKASIINVDEEMADYAASRR